MLVSNASVIVEAEALEVPPAPAPDTAQAPPTAKLTRISSPPRKRVGGGGGGAGGGPPAGGGAKAVASDRRGFNQDDLFGLIFGIAVIAFLIMWLMRGRSDGLPPEDGLVGIQSATNTQAIAGSPPPATRVDPFGNAPVDLRPSGPIPEPLPAIEASPLDVMPPPAAAPASPPVPPRSQTASAAAVATAPLAERKMHGWFCTASSSLTKASRSALEAELINFVDVFAGKELVVRGYADTRGSSAYNTLLSGERARVVADFLETKGLTVADYNGVGELNGLDDNQNCPNQRRVDVWVKGGPAAAPSRECAPEPAVASLVCD